MDIVCQNCGSVNDYTERIAGPHISAYCNGCDKYIKHLPQGTPPTLYFGKYKGRLLSSMQEGEEIKYLLWLKDQAWIKDKLRGEILNHLAL